MEQYIVQTRSEADKLMASHLERMKQEIEAAKREGREPALTACSVLVNCSGNSRWFMASNNRLRAALEEIRDHPSRAWHVARDALANEQSI